MINCRLTRISGLDSVGASLLHLSLSDQQITRIEGLSVLVHLRSLCLQQNRIEAIDGLQRYETLAGLWLLHQTLWITESQTSWVMRTGRLPYRDSCQKLQKLWLYGNHITKVANLAACSDLRELWLQVPPYYCRCCCRSCVLMLMRLWGVTLALGQ